MTVSSISSLVELLPVSVLISCPLRVSVNGRSLGSDTFPSTVFVIYLCSAGVDGRGECLNISTMP